MTKILIGSDHGGFNLKTNIVKHLESGKSAKSPWPIETGSIILYNMRHFFEGKSPYG